jgi:Rrf2 family transcriptional regulator, nitric oxide-sensitive transcriptional repressor
MPLKNGIIVLEYGFWKTELFMDRTTLSNAFSLALHSLVILAEHPERPHTTSEISLKAGVSSHHLSKVHTRLVHHGILCSVRGPNGGLKLSMKPSDITLMDVYQVIEGPFPERSCMLGKPVCTRKSCLFGTFFKDCNDRLRTYFEQTRISDLIETDGSE